MDLMINSNFTLIKRRTTQLCSSIFLLLACMLFSQQAFSQCSLACNGLTQVSLDATCSATITADMILNDQATSCAGGTFVVTVMDSDNNPIATSPMVGASEIGATLTVKVEDTASGNSCWGDIVIEDKIAPVIDCAAAQAAIDAAPFVCYDLTAFNLHPFIVENCAGYSINLTSEVVTPNECDGTFSDEVLKVISRTYTVTDIEGNVSDPCTLTFTVERIPGPPFTNIICPSAFLDQAGDALACDGDYATDENGNPAPSVTGVPYLDTDLTVDTWGPTDLDPLTDTNGDGDFDNDNDPDGNPANDRDIALYPAPDVYCNILSSYSDVKLPAIGCITKIIRTWDIIEWNCAPRTIPSCVQMIEISDSEAPTYTCPSDMTVTTNINGSYTGPHGSVNCAASVLLPAIVATDNCDTAIEVDIDYPGGFLDNSNGGTVELPLGDNVVTYTVYDGCYNSSSCSFTVTVEDKTAPVSVCQQFTVVGLTGNGEAIVHANSFDSGSYDDCSLDRVRVWRMDQGVPCGDDIDTFEETVKFCCADIGTPVTIVLRAYDTSGNFNDCMVTVDVQDKLAPSITCPIDMTVTCTTVYDSNNLDATFGTADASDNCSVSMTQTATFDLNQCNVGTITRTFTATDAGSRTASCQQVITFENPSPFGCSDIVEPFGSPDDIAWPADNTMTGCLDPGSDTFSPDNTGFPTFSDDQCDLVGSNFVDQVFPFNNGTGDACFKIIREWTVIDWCQFGSQCDLSTTDPTDRIDIGNQYATWTWTQVIKVNNTIAPTITSDCTEKTTCTFDAECQNGFIELTAAATDDCTDALSWQYDIDANNDGSFDFPSVSGTGNAIDASGEYPVGSHRIVYTFRDKCGNVTSCEQLFTINNCKAPTPYCLNGLATDLMPMDTDGDGTADTGMVELWASDFDNGSYHACGYRIVLSFSQDTTQKNMVFDCTTTGQQTVDLYATAVDADDNIISFAFCTTFINIQDNNMVCTGGNNPMGRIAGTITTELDETLEEVNVTLDGSANNDEITNASGEYAFPEMNFGGSYTIMPEKNVDHLNGVSTLDLVLIQKHILGIKDLDSPYKVIAADINNDKGVSAVDLIELRKLILGVHTEFNNNESWRFVDANYTFQDEEQPLTEDFPESYSIEGFNADMNVDFTAVKVGDVNSTAATNFDNADLDVRNESTLNFHINNKSFENGELIEVPVFVNNDMDILGYQYTLDFDPSVLEFVGSRAGEILVESYNYGIQDADQGLVTSSWNTVTPELLMANDIAFTLVFRATTSGTLSDNIDFTSEMTTAEAYDANHEVLDVKLNVGNQNADLDALGYVLYQNTPNPFDNSTEVAFNLPEAMDAQLRIYDVQGKTIKTYSGMYQKGMNVITVDKDALNLTGILYYTLETDNYTATKRMVVIK